jgi:hypothetical protein
LSTSRTPGAEPLPGERRHDVRGVAGEQDATRAPRGRHPRVVRVHRDAPDLEQLRVGPAPDEVAPVGLLARAEHQLPAVQARRERQRHRRAPRVGDEPDTGDGGDRGVDVGVDDEPRLRERRAREAHAAQAPHRRARPVAGEDPGRSDLEGAVPVARVQRHPGAVLLEALDRATQPEVDVREAARARGEGVLELALVEGDELRMAVAALCRVEDLALAPGRVDRRHRPEDMQDRRERLAQPGALQDALAAVVEDGRPGRPVRLRRALQADRPQAELAQPVGRQLPDGPEADDGHIDGR